MSLKSAILVFDSSLLMVMLGMAMNFGWLAKIIGIEILHEII